jgi:hypothetical protein
VAEKLGHPALANDEVRQEVLTYQHECGGVWGNKDKDEYMQSLNPLVPSFFTEWALAAGLGDAAKRSADFLAMMVDQNRTHMSSEPGRFYLNYDPREERLVTEANPGGDINCFVDTTRPKQQFYQIGTAMAGLACAYRALGEERHLQAALKLAEFENRLEPEGLRWPSYCKIGWGAAELYGVTGMPAHRVMASNVAEKTFIAAQTADGGWENMIYPLKDHGVWEDIHYDGSGTVPTSPVDDGSWARLLAEEIAGEFLGEMGRILAVFRQALVAVERRL